MQRFDLSSLLRPELSEVVCHQPEGGEYPVRLDANEAPPLLTAHAHQQLARCAAQVAWERYPDPTATALRNTIAESMRLSPDEILLGAGSDELIGLLLTACSHPRTKDRVPTLLTTSPTFVRYRMSARARGYRVLELPLDAQWDLPLDAVEQALAIASPNVIFLASPNNPTGTLVSPDRLSRLVELARESLVVIDEAYVAYADRDQMDCYRNNDNVAILRTLSAVGFASLRLGWLVAHPALRSDLDKIRMPYNVGSLTQRMAHTVLRELSSEVDATIRFVRDERARVVDRLTALAGVNVEGSDANFVWLRTVRPADDLFEQLKHDGILVRSFHHRGGRLRHYLRATVGTREQNDALLRCLEKNAGA